MSNTDHNHQLHLKPWIAWIAASAVGGMIVGALESGGFEFLATLFLSGAIVGTAQMFVLRRYLSRMGWWPVASAIGWIAGVYLISAVSLVTAQLEWDQWVVDWLRQPITFAIAGVTQALVLQRSGQPGRLWIIVSALGGAVYDVVGSTFCLAACDAIRIATTGQIATAITYAIAWAAYAIVTGLVWVRWIRDRSSHPQV